MYPQLSAIWNVPDWPSDDAWNDTKRFYVVKTSEWQESKWIYLYLELLLRANDRWSSRLYKEFLSKARIVKVAIETNIGDVKQSNERLKAKCANIYITFTGLETDPRIDEIGEHVERKAIVRRVISSTGSLTLVGKLWSGKDTTKLTRKHTPTSGEKGQSSKKRSHPY
ncbi:unnamed protein product [Arabis nemorensis]|uniref:Uncharacterized protein n=1 Tax=Arabis nemorensis TaxID=586526 RepID=A0A565BHK5_9BRAS|nr:unnamed protein product [Arabis nemorensis]